MGLYAFAAKLEFVARLLHPTSSGLPEEKRKNMHPLRHLGML